MRSETATDVKARCRRRRRLLSAHVCVLAVALIGLGNPVQAQYQPEPTRTLGRVLRVDSSNESSSIPLTTTADESGSTRPTIPSLAEHRKSSGDGDASAISSGTIAGPAVTVTSSLAVVLGLFALMIWCTRKFGKKTLGQTSLPGEVLQSLGTATLDARTKINLLRCGARVIVVAQTSTGIYPISEFTSPEEVRQLIASCQSNSKHSFAQTLRAFEQEPAPKGFVGPSASPTNAAEKGRERGRLFTTA